VTIAILQTMPHSRQSLAMLYCQYEFIRSGIQGFEPRGTTTERFLKARTIALPDLRCLAESTVHRAKTSVFMATNFFLKARLDSFEWGVFPADDNLTFT